MEFPSLKETTHFRLLWKRTHWQKKNREQQKTPHTEHMGNKERLTNAKHTFLLQIAIIPKPEVSKEILGGIPVVNHRLG